MCIFVKHVEEYYLIVVFCYFGNENLKNDSYLNQWKLKQKNITSGKHIAILFQRFKYPQIELKGDIQQWMLDYMQKFKSFHVSSINSNERNINKIKTSQILYKRFLFCGY